MTDRDECSTGLHTCAGTETCINEVGGYRCEINADADPSSSSSGGLTGSTTPNFGDATASGSDEDDILDNTIPDTGFSRRTGQIHSNDISYSPPVPREASDNYEMRHSRAPHTTPSPPPSTTTDCPGGMSTFDFLLLIVNVQDLNCKTVKHAGSCEV